MENLENNSLNGAGKANNTPSSLLYRFSDQLFAISKDPLRLSYDMLKMGTNLLFIMNGASIIALVTFLGSVSNLGDVSLLWLLIGLMLFITGIFYSIFLILRTMKMSQLTFLALFKVSNILVKKGVTDEDKLVEFNTYIQTMSAFEKDEQRTDMSLLIYTLSSFIIGVGCSINGVLCIRFSLSYSLYLGEIIFGAIVFFILKQAVNRLFNKKLPT